MATTGRKGRWDLDLVVSDIHSLFVDLKALDVVMQVLHETDVKTLYINGDLMDFCSISAHVPKIKKVKGNAFLGQYLPRHTLRMERDVVREHILAPLRKAAGKKTRIVYRTAANHEDRYTKPSADSKGLAEICQVEAELGVRRGNLRDLLTLDQWNIETDHKQQTLIKGKILITHGECATEAAPKKNFMDYKCSGISSHTHRMGLYEERARGTGEKFIWVESGHLRTQDEVEYLSKPPNWQQGFLALYTRSDGAFEIQRHQIHKYRSWFNGQLFAA